jgi:beta-phosphoglucomutase-like phosphatase (HAD superfamily)
LGFEKDIGFIFDIDGVVVNSPHEEAWRQTAKKWGIKRFTSEDYLRTAAGRPRDEGAEQIFEHFGLYERLGLEQASEREAALERFCAEKQQLIEDYIKREKFEVYESTIRLMLEAKADGVRLAAASSSKNARPMLKRIDLYGLVTSRGWPYAFVKEGDRLYDLFDVDVCGRTFKHGKPHPEIFLTAASVLCIDPSSCVVFEDAISGVRAAKRGRMFCVGIVRIGTPEDLRNAGADVVVEDLDEVSYRALTEIAEMD